MFDTLLNYLSYEFVLNALIVGVLISICASLLGVSLVLKRLSYIGDSLSHTAFGIMAISALLSFIDNIYFVLISMIFITIFITKYNNKLKMQGDALLTLFSVSALGIGYLVMSISNTSANLGADVCSVLFGSTAILTLNSNDLIVTLILSILIILVYIIFYHKFFAVTFDENFSKASGLNTNLYNNIFSIILAVIVVLAINLVGSLLISALIIFPTLASTQIFKSYKSIIISAISFSIICTFFGIIIAILFGTPVGATIVALDLFGYIILYFIGVIRR